MPKSAQVITDAFGFAHCFLHLASRSASQNLSNRKGKNMKTVRVYEEGETVMIKAKVSKVIFDKDRISYELKDFGNDQRYLTKFSDKDILPFEEEAEE